MFDKMLCTRSLMLGTLVLQLLSITSDALNGDWSQIGSDINGETNGDLFGTSVSLSANGTILLAGAPYNDGTTNNSPAVVADTGQVRAYKLDLSVNQFTQFGSDIQNRITSQFKDQFGQSLAMSSDGMTLIIGAPQQTDTSNVGGYARVYKYDTSIQQYRHIGSDIVGAYTGDYFGFSVDMSADGTTFVIGAPSGNWKCINAGHVRVFRFDSDGTDFVQVGIDLYGFYLYDFFGQSVSMSTDGTTIIVGTVYHNEDSVMGIKYDSGRVGIYRLMSSTNNYKQVGDFIYGENEGDNFGFAVTMSGDGTMFAIGAPFNGGNGGKSGHVRVYKVDALGQYVQIGFDIEGEAPGDLFGYSLQMSVDGARIVVGAPNNDGTFGLDSGHVRVFQLNVAANQYQQIGSDINGEATGDLFGTSVALSSGDGETIAVGAPNNRGNGIQSGHVRVFKFDPNKIPPPPTIPIPSPNSMIKPPTKIPTRFPVTVPVKPPPPCGFLCFIWNIICRIF